MVPWSIEELKRESGARAAAGELLFQLADDDFIMGYRDQEWLGLAPHIEEDVAFGSIGQEEIGHAALYYRLLEELGFGRADDLASLRPAEERRNAVLLEQPNGTGDYLDNPHFDWAWTIVRHYCHDLWEIARLEGLRGSRVTPMREAAEKILGEKRYHRAHQELWMRTMASRNGESRERLASAVAHVGEWAGDLTEWGPARKDLIEWGILPDPDGVKAQFRHQLEAFLTVLDVSVPTIRMPFNGREGQHTKALTKALEHLSEVYRLDPLAQW